GTIKDLALGLVDFPHLRGGRVVNLCWKYGETVVSHWRGLPKARLTAASGWRRDRKSTRLNSSHEWISYAVFCLKKKNSMISLAGLAQAASGPQAAGQMIPSPRAFAQIADGSTHATAAIEPSSQS